MKLKQPVAQITKYSKTIKGADLAKALSRMCFPTAKSKSMLMRGVVKRGFSVSV